MAPLAPGPWTERGALRLRLVEELVHGWDLARATGGLMTVDDEVVESALAFTTDTLSGIDPARSPFAPPQPVDESAAPLGRLVALLGRQP